MAAITGNKLLITGIVMVVLGAAGMAWLGIAHETMPAPGDAPEGVVQVYKAPECGCCSDWAGYMKDKGFDVSARDVDVSKLYAIKSQAGLPDELASCHTAFLNGYVIEGHVPANEIRRLLAEQPDALGLAVPGMPLGSPGMESGDRRDAYSVLLFDPDGSRVYGRYHQP